jgi:hypothetical protein
LKSLFLKVKQRISVITKHEYQRWIDRGVGEHLMFTANWDQGLGLWWNNRPIHVREICRLERAHPGPDAAGRLLSAVRLGRLQEVDVKRVLKNLRAMVWTADDDRRGCIKWYWEEDLPHDPNAAFFTALPLVCLRIAHPDQLDTRELADLDWILGQLLGWFLRCCEEQHENYPNKYLGDLVCAWLIMESRGGKVAEPVATAMRRAAKYWSGAGRWGHGEHLGLYIDVLLDELSALLVLARKLPKDIHADYLVLLNDLLAIQDAFGDGPPVPAIRCYSNTESPNRESAHYRPYRDRVRAWKPDESIEFSNRCMLGDLLAAHGWHDLVAPRRPPVLPAMVSIPCFDGAVAHAYVDWDIRLGGMSRFPIMDFTEGPGGGLSWQSFPVALWRSAGDWGFLMWHATENGIWRAHPMGVERTAETPRQLTEAVDPPITGRTEAIMRDGDLVAARYMPARSHAWTESGDCFRIIRTSARAVIERAESSDVRGCEGSYARALFTWPDRTVSVELLNLTDPRLPELRRNEFGGYDFRINHDLSRIHRGPVMDLWRIRLDGGESGFPAVERYDVPHQPRPAGSRAVRIRWRDRQFRIVPPVLPLLREESG